MKAAVVAQYAPPEMVRIVDVEIPQPRDNEILVKVHAAAVTAGDARLRSGNFPPGFGIPAKLAIGVQGPRKRILGMVYSGVIESVGPLVQGFKVGDEVAGMTGARMGGHAQYLVTHPEKIAFKPRHVSHADAAGVVFGGMTALWFLQERASLKTGETVLVNGASGAVGTSAVQLAKSRGAHVTAVCSEKNGDFVRSLGADELIDYHKTPVAKLSDNFDVILDAVGNVNRKLGERLLTDNGRMILAVADFWTTVRSRGKVITGAGKERPEDFKTLLEMLSVGQLDAVTENLGDLDSLVEAYRRVDSKHKVGNLVIDPR